VLRKQQIAERMERKRGKKQDGDEEKESEKRFKVDDYVNGFQLTDLDGDIEEGQKVDAIEEQNIQVPNAAETLAMIDVSSLYLI
jgi:hypothetical protein